MRNLYYWLFFSVGILATAKAQSTDQNYVKTTEYKYATTSSIQGVKAVKVVYFDGLGRPKQEVIAGNGMFSKNIITHFAYDLNKGQTKQYLPFVAQSISYTAKPNFIADAESKTLEFYNKPKYQNTKNPYSETVFEKSPLRRPEKQGAPGNDWKIATGSTAHNIDYTYDFNLASQVRNYKAVATWNESKGYYETVLQDKGIYPISTLYRKKISDENTNITNEFKDQEGRVVMASATRDVADIFADPNLPGTSSASSSSVSSHRDFTSPLAVELNTYYVYDQFGNLTYVLPPMVDGIIDLVKLDKWCYQYRYDVKNRLVAKKLPAKDWEYMVYDRADRLVANGPVYSPFGDGTVGWLISKYDVFGRVVYTGFYTGITATDNGRKSYADFVGSSLQQFEKKATATSIESVMVPYTKLTFPTSDFKILHINFYDDYNFPDAPINFGLVAGQEIITNAKGMQTGSWTRVATEIPSEVKSTLSYNLYNYQGHVIRSFEKNYLGGFTQIDSEINFRGLPTKVITNHTYSREGGEKKIEEGFTYNVAEQVLSHSHKVANQKVEILTYNAYDNLRVLMSKEVGAVSGNFVMGGTPPPLQKVDFRYNIRGWLIGINDVNKVLINREDASLFSLKLDYNSFDEYRDPNQFPAPGINSSHDKSLYNGNIAKQIWRNSNGLLQSYNYEYDSFNRLGRGFYSFPRSISSMVGAYNERLTYDANGNILSLKRSGPSENGNVIEIDDLQYTYNGNQLQKVTDATNNSEGFKKGSHTGNDYTYDGFGNMISDKNKGISQIKYNHLNLPTEITMTAGKINYIYTTAGVKLQKKVTPTNGAVVTTDYFGGFQYENGELQFFPTAEGYYNARTNKYVYQYKDHLGNVRLSYSDTNGDGLITPDEVLSENNYYPFGLQHQGDNPAVAQANKAAEKYKYNSKEFQDELGVNLYDYGARNYDASLGRWFNVDPLAEQFPGWTPYHYVHNNPINLIDPTGMSARDPGWIEHATNEGDKLLTYDAEINTKQEAKDKGYRNVKTVSESLSYNGTSGFESYNLNENGLVSDNLTGATTDVGFSPMRTGDGYYISENNPLKSFASGLQSGGDALTYTGLSFSITGVGAPVGGAMMAIGGAMGLIGTGIESAYMFGQGKKGESLTKAGISVTFVITGKLGVIATERAIGTGLNSATKTLIDGINITTEKTIGAGTEKMLTK